MPRRLLRLLLIATIFMFAFQLETRLISYVYLFHEGLLLIQAMLLGGGGLLLARELLPVRAITWLERVTPVAILAAFLLQQALFFTLNSFWVDFATLSLLFAFVFNEIASLVDIQSNRFYAFELLGSFIGVGLYALAVLFFLEEVLLVVVAVVLTVYAAGSWRQLGVVGSGVLVTLAGLVLVYGTVLQSHSLPALVQCSVGGTAYGYKSACLDDVTGQEPDASFTHLKGRSDVFIRENGYGLEFLEVKNTGYRVSAANREEWRDESWFEILEHRIPKLAYPAGADVLSVGAGAGSYVQALYDYIEEPNITAVEIDQTVADIYASDQFDDFLPARDSYDIVYDEGRRHLTLNDSQYDVITIAIEGINSTLPKYVDERTGLLYSREALATYISRLRPGGYLVLEQYYPLGPAGDAMGAKVLETLQQASGEPMQTFREHIYLYSWAFHPEPGAQRFIAGIYKPDGFTEADMATMEAWITALQTTELNNEINPHRITTIHTPSNVSEPVEFGPYFDEAQREQLANVANVAAITDDKPFRHLVTQTPFPPLSYSIFLAIAAVIFFLVARLRRRPEPPRLSLLAVSAGFGVLTFGLQYLLFYKTAAFIHTSLIFFSIFLLLPLAFSALGGYLATYRRITTTWGLVLAWGLLATSLAVVNVFAAPRAAVLLVIATLFAISGVLFPRVLDRAQSLSERRAIYACNVIAGGFALVIMVTLHAVIGWALTFAVVAILLALSLWSVR